MKILAVHNCYQEPGGEDEVFKSETRLLTSYGHKVIKYFRNNEELKDFSLLEKAGFLVKDIAWSNKAYEDIKEIIRLEKPDVAHVHNIFYMISPSVFQALREEKIPVVQSLHNYRFFCANGLFFRSGKVCERCGGGNFLPATINKCWRNSYLLSFFLARALKKNNSKGIFKACADVYVASSEFLRCKFIEKGFPAGKIVVKPHFADISGFYGSRAKDYVLFAGRLVDYKGIETLLSAASDLRECKFKIIGDGPLYSKVKRCGLPNVEFLGRLPYEKIVDYMRQARFLVAPSLCYETFGRVIIEAFACGIPVVASDAGAFKELICDGVTGFLFASGNAGDLAAKIKILHADEQLSDKMGVAALGVYREKYTACVNYSLLLDIYEKAIKSQGSYPS